MVRSYLNKGKPKNLLCMTCPVTFASLMFKSKAVTERNPGESVGKGVLMDSSGIPQGLPVAAASLLYFVSSSQ